MELISESPRASLVLMLWPLLTIVLFLQLEPAKAAISSFILGVLYIPRLVVLGLPVLPDLDGGAMTALAILVGGLALGKGLFSGVKLGTGPKVFFVALIFADILRALTNGDPVDLAIGAVDGIAPQTALTFVLTTALTTIFPFYLGAALGARPERLRHLIVTWLAAGVVYAGLAMIELRMSPQINIWTYGYFQHDWGQMLRSGGYRPIVYMGHALELALFMCAAGLFALTMRSSKMTIWGVSAGKYALLFGVITLLTKCMGAFSYFVLAAVLLTRFGPVARARFASILGLLILAYPIARMAEALPLDDIIETIASFKPKRAGSLKVRFDHEEDFLVKVGQRMWTGWGGFGRISVYDPVTGKTDSIVDGAWIAQLLSGGLVLLYAWLGLLLWPVLTAVRRVKRFPKGSVARELLASLSVITGFYVLDLIPNGGYDSIAVMLAGVLTGMSCSSPSLDWEGAFGGGRATKRKVRRRAKRPGGVSHS